MTTLPKVLAFEWDSGNLDKSYTRHGITSKEAEEVFVCEDLYVQKDIKHSQEEKRLIAFGKSSQGNYIFIVFTFRSHKIRIISARKMHRKEVLKYEEAKKYTKI